MFADLLAHLLTLKLQGPSFIKYVDEHMERIRFGHNAKKDTTAAGNKAKKSVTKAITFNPNNTKDTADLVDSIVIEYRAMYNQAHFGDVVDMIRSVVNHDDQVDTAAKSKTMSLEDVIKKNSDIVQKIARYLNQELLLRGNDVDKHRLAFVVYMAARCDTRIALLYKKHYPAEFDEWLTSSEKYDLDTIIIARKMENKAFYSLIHFRLLTKVILYMDIGEVAAWCDDLDIKYDDDGKVIVQNIGPIDVRLKNALTRDDMVWDVVDTLFRKDETPTPTSIPIPTPSTTVPV